MAVSGLHVRGVFVEELRIFDLDRIYHVPSQARELLRRLRPVQLIGARSDRHAPGLRLPQAQPFPKQTRTLVPGHPFPTLPGHSVPLVNHDVVRCFRPTVLKGSGFLARTSPLFLLEEFRERMEGTLVLWFYSGIWLDERSVFSILLMGTNLSS